MIALNKIKLSIKNQGADGEARQGRLDLVDRGSKRKDLLELLVNTFVSRRRAQFKGEGHVRYNSYECYSQPGEYD